MAEDTDDVDMHIVEYVSLKDTPLGSTWTAILRPVVLSCCFHSNEELRVRSRIDCLMFLTKTRSISRSAMARRAFVMQARSEALTVTSPYVPDPMLLPL